MPKGIGKNGVVFETIRPDDPEPYKMRFQNQIDERQSNLDSELKEQKKEE